MQVQVPGQGVFKRVFKGDLDIGGGPEGELKGDLEVDLEVDLEGTSNRTWKGTYCQAQVRSGPGLVQYRAQI